MDIWFHLIPASFAKSASLVTATRVPAKSLQLDKFLPYRLSIASLLVSDVIARAYARMFALNVPEWRLVAVLAEGPGMTQQQICLRTRMDKVTVSRAAIALANRSLAKRTPNPGDGRSHILTLSPEGRDLYERVVPQALELEKRIFGRIDPEDLERFSQVLDQIAQAAADVGQDGD